MPNRQIASEKAALTVAALAQLMPNTRRPREWKRKLLNSVVHSKMLYGAEIWAEADQRETVRRRLASVQRRSMLRLILAYRTVSEDATLVLESTPPVDLLIRERKEIYLECQGVSDIRRRREAKKAARQRLLDRWQQRWDTGTTERWTYRLIPNLAKWYKRKHGEMEYYLTQALTGHGPFNEYLARFGKRASTTCLHCSYTPGNAHHTMFECPITESDRDELNDTLGIQICESNLISCMLKDEEAWTTVSKYITKTMRIKRKMEEAERNK